MVEKDGIERVLREQEHSGQSAVDFCRERNIPIMKFYGWRKRRRDKLLGFARVQTSITVMVEVGSARLHVPLEALKAVLTELGQR